MATTSMSLSPHWDAFIKEQVASGRYGSASEVMREALRMMETRERKLAALRALVDEAEADVEAGRLVPLPTIDELMDEALAARRAG